jgi:hypothetical protein
VETSAKVVMESLWTMQAKTEAASGDCRNYRLGDGFRFISQGVAI